MSDAAKQREAADELNPGTVRVSIYHGALVVLPTAQPDRYHRLLSSFDLSSCWHAGDHVEWGAPVPGRGKTTGEVVVSH